MAVTNFTRKYFHLTLEKFKKKIILSVYRNFRLPYVVMRKAAAESKENAVDDRGFFAKYWMYVLPLVAILLMNAGGSSNSS